ncbi:MAG: hypothetical protein EXR83_03495 [Gammaproteobacteria bacterium]|nr:hypothetical protein [Gammaproteobacteria bacterium]
MNHHGVNAWVVTPLGERLHGGRYQFARHRHFGVVAGRDRDPGAGREVQRVVGVDPQMTGAAARAQDSASAGVIAVRWP